jgi:hemolysin III
MQSATIMINPEPVPYVTNAALSLSPAAPPSSALSGLSAIPTPISPASASIVTPIADSQSYSARLESALYAKRAEWELRWEQRKASFLADYEARKSSLQRSITAAQETINAWRSPDKEITPVVVPPIHPNTLRRQRPQHRVGPASVTYRPPYREDSVLHSSHHTGGLQSSQDGIVSSGCGDSSREHEGDEQSLTAHAESRWLSRDKAHAVDLSIFYEHAYEDEIEREDAMRELDAAYASSRASPDIISPETEEACSLEEKIDPTKVSENEPSLSACQIHAVDVLHHAMTIHKEGCKCEMESQHSCVIANNSARTSRSNSLAPSSHSITVHIHDESASNICDSSDSNSGSSAASPPENKSSWVVSALDPAFIVAPVSPELLISERWDDASCAYGPGLVPQAPGFLCRCWFPLRSWSHLWHHHVQPLCHARNVTFEGYKYPNWRGDFYPNGEPKAVLRGVTHELALILVVIYAGFLFSACISWIGFIGSAVNISTQLFLYGTSSQFHRRQWLLPSYNRLKRLDHTAIYTLAAGTSTLAGLLLIRDPENVGNGVSIAGWCLLGWAWFGAIVGTIDNIRKPLTGKVAPFGLVWMGIVGGCMLPFVYQLSEVMTPLEFGSTITAWLLYLAAILTYSGGFFNRWPSVFGYHEVFHALTILGAGAVGTFNYSIAARLT